MNLVKKLFGLSAKPTKVAAKTTNKAKPDTLSTSELVAIANGDKTQNIDAKALDEAVKRLNYGDELLLVAKSEGLLQREALKRIAQCLEEGSVNLPSLRQDLPQITHQLLVASYCTNKQHTASLLSELNNEDELVQVCLDSPSSQLRSQLIDHIHKEQNLKTLEKALRSSDKRNYKLIRARLDRIKLIAAERESKQQAAEHLIIELKAHAKRSVNSDYRFNADSLIRRCERLNEDLDEAQKATAEQALRDIQKNIDDSETNPAAVEAESLGDVGNIDKVNSNEAPENNAHSADREDASSSEPSQLTSEIELSNTLYKEVLEHYGNYCQFLFKTTEVNDEHLEALNTRFAETQSIFNSAHERLSSANKQTIETLNSALEEYLSQLNAESSKLRAYWNSILVLADSNADTDTDTEFTKKQDALGFIERISRPIRRHPSFKTYVGSTALCEIFTQNAHHKRKADQLTRAAERSIAGLIQKASFAVDNGQLKRAQGIRFSIMELIEAQAQISAHIARQWEDIQERIEKLSDWQSYAIIPKLEALIEKMKVLAETPLEAEAQSTKIKNLQDEWKSITKGSAGKHQELWDSFKQSADIAYEVCKAHFEQLDLVRQENSNKRAALIQQLNDYIKSYDWSNADWPQVEKLLRTAKTEWQSYTPSLRKNHRKEQDRFSAKVTEIQAHLDEEYTKNKTEKERLINSIEALAQSEDLAQAINITINFQKQWKTIGRCKYRDEDKLWKQFRAHCDAIFAKRDAERNAEREVLDTAVAEVNTALNAIEGLLNINDESFETAYRDIDSLKIDIDSLENLPKAKQSALQQRQNKLINKVETRLQALQQSKSQSGWKTLFTLKEQINRARNEDSREVIDSIKTQISELAFKPGQSQKALQESLNTQNHEPSIEHYKLLCIRAEILNDSSSPETDKALRMQYQVGQLQAGLGSQNDSREQLADEWFAGPVIPNNDYKVLSQRFCQQLNF